MCDLYRYLQHLPLKGMRVSTLADDLPTAEDATDSQSNSPLGSMSGGLSVFSGTRKNLFRIQSEKESFIVSAASPAIKAAWLNVLEQTLKEVNGSPQPLAAPAPVWMQDAESPVCLSCNRNFDTFRRRHHCRRCGLLFCKACCKVKLMFSRAFKKPQRVCNDCSQIIKNQEESSRVSFRQSQAEGEQVERRQSVRALDLVIDANTDLC
jgi:hypothetical protein